MLQEAASAEPSASTTDATVTSDATSDASTYRFLIVDDDPFVIMVLQALVLDQALPSLKLEVSCCANVSECLEQLGAAAYAAQPYDVVLLDHELGEQISGIEVLHAIRSKDDTGALLYPWLAGMRIVMMSSGEIDQDAFTGLGVESFLVKPITARHVQQIIEARIAEAEPTR